MIWLIGLGGSLGAGARFLLAIFINNRSRRVGTFPLGTYIINITGSFLLGVIVNLHVSNLISDWIWFFGGVGFCGAYTTFSTFGYETISLIKSKNIKRAIFYVTTSVMLGLVFSSIGLTI